MLGLCEHHRHYHMHPKHSAWGQGCFSCHFQRRKLSVSETGWRPRLDAGTGKLAPPFTNSMALGKLFEPSVPQFFNCKMGIMIDCGWFQTYMESPRTVVGLWEALRKSQQLPLISVTWSYCPKSHPWKWLDWLWPEDRGTAGLCSWPRHGITVYMCQVLCFEPHINEPSGGPGKPSKARTIMISGVLKMFNSPRGDKALICSICKFHT